jgi:hypothetical protein
LNEGPREYRAAPRYDAAEHSTAPVEGALVIVAPGREHLEDLLAESIIRGMA